MLYTYIKYLEKMNHCFFPPKKIKLKIKLLNRDAKVPVKADPGSAGYDVYSSEPVEIYSRARKLVSTGLSCEFSDKYYLRIAPRSGLSVKGIDIGAGVIDSSYRGEIKVLMINNSDITQIFQRGAKIAQFIMESCESPELELSDKLTDTSRGESGFGSSGQ